MSGQTGNIAQTLLIANQTINIGGEPQWIQTLPMDALKTARDRLHRASRRHEARAVIPLLAPIVAGVVVANILGLSMIDAPEAARHQAAPAMLWLAAVIAIPIWLGLYDVRRRHRRVVAAAERRWAELVVEIAAREDPPKRESPFKRIVRWWRARRSSPVAQGGQDVA